MDQKVRYERVLPDALYRVAVRLGLTTIVPQTVVCKQEVRVGGAWVPCGRPAAFKDDTLAARYECQLGHAAAAMWADRWATGERQS